MSHTQRSLLIMDDDSTLRLNLGTFFKDKGYKIFEAENGKEGLEIMLAEKPDAVLLDILMPEMDGIQVMKTVAEKHPEMLDRITLMTSSGSMKYLGDAIDLGVLRYILKSDMSLENVFKIVDTNVGK